VEKTVDRPTQKNYREKTAGEQQADRNGLGQRGHRTLVEEERCYQRAKPEKRDVQEHVPERYAALAAD
jgi:hypothetical protein